MRMRHFYLKRGLFFWIMKTHWTFQDIKAGEGADEKHRFRVWKEHLSPRRRAKWMFITLRFLLRKRYSARDHWKVIFSYWISVRGVIQRAKTTQPWPLLFIFFMLYPFVLKLQRKTGVFDSILSLLIFFLLKLNPKAKFCSIRNNVSFQIRDKN